MEHGQRGHHHHRPGPTCHRLARRGNVEVRLDDEPVAVLSQGQVREHVTRVRHQHQLALCRHVYVRHPQRDTDVRGRVTVVPPDGLRHRGGHSDAACEHPPLLRSSVGPVGRPGVGVRPRCGGATARAAQNRLPQLRLKLLRAVGEALHDAVRVRAREETGAPSRPCHNHANLPQLVQEQEELRFDAARTRRRRGRQRWGQGSDTLDTRGENTASIDPAASRR